MGVVMTKVFVLNHVVVRSGVEDNKLVGVYSTEASAKAAIERVKDKPGFRDSRDGFIIDPYRLDMDYWADGFGLD